MQDGEGIEGRMLLQLLREIDRRRTRKMAQLFFVSEPVSKRFLATLVVVGFVAGCAACPPNLGKLAAPGSVLQNRKKHADPSVEELVGMYRTCGNTDPVSHLELGADGSFSEFVSTDDGQTLGSEPGTWIQFERTIVLTEHRQRVFHIVYDDDGKIVILNKDSYIDYAKTQNLDGLWGAFCLARSYSGEQWYWL
jgi:hypothetical protein